MRNLLIMLIATVLASAALIGCQAGAPPPKFEVSSLQIKPNQINTGETATITAVVTNTGGSAGLYNAVLLFDTVTTGTKGLQLGPGASTTVTFQITGKAPGTYPVEIGDTSGVLTVKPKLVAKPTELKYDSGFPKDYLAPEKPTTGYLVSFDVPSTEFIIHTIRIMGLVYGGRGVLMQDPELQIWDSSSKVIYSSVLDRKKFPQLSFLLSNDLENKGGWVDTEIPYVKVSGEFFVHIYTGSNTGQGFRLGADNSGPNTHSELTIRNEKGVDIVATTWPYPGSYWYGDKTYLNWMVRAIGDAMLPE